MKDLERSRLKTPTSFENVEKARGLFVHTKPVSQTYYVERMSMLRETVHKKSPELGSDNLFLHHNSPPAQRACLRLRGGGFLGLEPSPKYLRVLASCKMKFHVEWTTISSKTAVLRGTTLKVAPSR